MFFKKLKIDNYRVINRTEYLKSISAAFVKPLKSANTYDKNDSSNFIIKILSQGLETNLSNHITRLKQSEFEAFVVNHKNEIDKAKIYLIGKGDVPFKIWKKVNSVLKKYQYYCEMVTEDK